jgi:amidophosphoribosyltransferase
MCGVFGIYGVEEAANYTYFGLYALQHRGQESAGIVVYDGKKGKRMERVRFSE